MSDYDDLYRGALDLTLFDRFVTAFLEEALLSEAEIHALPDMVRTIWLCAPLDPPLEPPPSRLAAPHALPEIQIFADWALAHGPALVENSLAAQEAQAGRLHSLLVQDPARWRQTVNWAPGAGDGHRRSFLERG